MLACALPASKAAPRRPAHACHDFARRLTCAPLPGLRINTSGAITLCSSAACSRASRHLQRKVWNRGDWRCKLVTLCLTKRAAEAEASRLQASSSTGTGSFVSVAASSEEEESTLR